MPAARQRRAIPGLGPGDVIYKAVHVTVPQDRVVRELMIAKRWSFQTLCAEALRTYALGQGRPWPDDTTEDSVDDLEMTG